MPQKNKGKKGKKNKDKRRDGGARREIVFKEDGQEYAQVLKMLGNCRMEVYCFDGVKRQATIRGQMRNRNFINRDDIILIGLRDFQDSKADVIHKYRPDEARTLKAYGELPETVNIAATEEPGEEEEKLFEFVDEEEGEQQKVKANSSSYLDLPEISSDEEISLDDL